MIDEPDAELRRTGEDRFDRGFSTLLRKPRGDGHPTEIMGQLNRFERRRHRGIDPLGLEQRRRVQPRIHPHHLEFEASHRDEEIASPGTIEFPGSGARLPGGDLHPRHAHPGDHPESGARIGRQRCEGEAPSGSGIVGTGHHPTISRRVVYDSEMSGSTSESSSPSEGVHVAIEPGGLTPSDPDALQRTDEAIGGECVFRGRTRPEIHPERGALLALDYEVHPTLATRSLRTIADEIMATFGLTALSIRHASGPVSIGEISVEIVAIAGHRDAAFRGCREAIDRLKRETPIWKQERWTDATSWSAAATPIHPPRHDDGDHA